MCFSCIRLILDTGEAENMPERNGERNIISQVIAALLLNYKSGAVLLVLGVSWAYHLVSQVNRWPTWDHQIPVHPP
jgi:hypothetical protein